MKRINIIVLSLLMLSVSTLVAQEEQKKREKAPFVLPKAGDIALSVDLVPILGYVGDIFNNTANNSYNSFGGEPTIATFGAPINNPTVSIMGKYMITDQIAARVNIGMLSRKQTNVSYSIDDQALLLNPLSEAKVTDEKIVNNTGASFMVGAEYRRGYKRIQGFGGANLIYAYGHYKERYKYGNAMTDVNQVPSRLAAPLPAGVVAPSYWNTPSLLSHYNNGTSHSIGIGAHVGFEIFVMSHMSLGGEVFFNILYNMGAQQYAVIEGFNTLNNEVEKRTELISPGDNLLTVGTENLGGKLYLTVYF